MVEMKHTAGPWKVFRTTDGEQIIGIGQASTGDGVTDPRFGLWCSGEEREANASLIAAAPEMILSLEEEALFLDGMAALLEGWARASREGGWSTHQVDANRGQAKICRDRASRIRGLISKVTSHNLKDGRE